MAYLLENIVILSAKRATFRCILWGISRYEGLRRLNSSVLEDKVVLYLGRRLKQIGIKNQDICYYPHNSISSLKLDRFYYIRVIN